MKRFLATMLTLVMCLGILAGCGETTAPTTTAPAAPATTAAPTTKAPEATTAAPTTAAPTTEAPTTAAPTTEAVPVAKRAAEYLSTLYEKMSTPTPEDFVMPAVIAIDGKRYDVVWTVEVESGNEAAVTVGAAENNQVVIDVDEENPEETLYKLVATITVDGVSESASFGHLVPAAASGDLSVAETMARLFALEAGESLNGVHVLRGTITEIPTAYSADYDNITVNLLVTDEEHIVQAYRLKGGADLKEGETITVMGALKRYKDTFEFDAGAVFSRELSVEEMKQKVVLDKLFALEAGDALKGTFVLKGTVVEIPTAYSADYDNVTVNLKIFEDDDRIVQAYRLKGGADLKVGDEIIVVGSLKRYKDTFEFDAGAEYVDASATLELVKAAMVVEQLYALEAGDSLKGLYTLPGVVTEIVTPYSADYKNITVNIQVTDEEHLVQCYRLAGGEELKVGDVITVTGNLKRYKDTFEFDAGATYVMVEP